MVDISYLPLEILTYIFDVHLGDVTEWVVVTKTLRAAALVQRRWRDSAQRVLFATFKARSASRAEAWLHSEARSLYPPRRLQLVAQHWHIVKEGLSWHSSVKELEISGRDRWWTDLTSPCLSSLEVLILRSAERFKDPPEYPAGRIPPLPFHLSHLALAYSSLSPSLHLIQALLNSSIQTLKSLSLEASGTGWSSLVQVARELQPIAGSLRSLEVRGHPFRPDQTYIPVDFIQRCTSLRTLRLFAAYEDNSRRESMLAIGRNLPEPATVDRLVYKRSGKLAVALENLTIFLSLPGAALLRRIDIVRASGGDLRAQLDALPTAAAFRTLAEQRSIVITDGVHRIWSIQ